MSKHLKVGDRVSWNSDSGHVVGRILHVHRRDVVFLSRLRRASEDEPQYEVKSEKTGAVALHKPDALKRLE